jgi:hypothetical protein
MSFAKNIHKSRRIYLYKVSTDNGGAPAVHRGRLSLAICKPRILAAAEVGDWIIGVAGKSLHPDSGLLFIAQVDEILEDGEYYRDSRFARRPDTVYEWKGFRLKLRANARFHDSEDAFRDIGLGPTYSKARVLLSSRFRYFGRVTSDWYAAVSPLAHQMGRARGIGHKVDLSEVEYKAWMKVIRAALRVPPVRTRPTQSLDVVCRH